MAVLDANRWSVFCRTADLRPLPTVRISDGKRLRRRARSETVVSALRRHRADDVSSEGDDGSRLRPTERSDRPRPRHNGSDLSLVFKEGVALREDRLHFHRQGKQVSLQDGTDAYILSVIALYKRRLQGSGFTARTVGE
ncbi:hypothetical protein Bbelb_279180 [Branchiostoma belcheri]|nr:hypothetical protein Bbelb_279180 [Branchiostoma belcheri]